MKKINHLPAEQRSVPSEKYVLGHSSSKQASRHSGRKINENDVKAVLAEVIDPELGVNMVDLGLLYEINISNENHVDIVMTLTTPGCPLGSFFRKDIHDRLASLEGVTSSDVRIIFDPPWDFSRVTEEAKAQLGFVS